MKKVINYIFIFIYLLTFFPVFRDSAWADPLSAFIEAESAEVYIGEPFLVNIYVEGSSSPDTPDLSGITEFSVQEEGSSNNSSSSITIINGRMTRKERQRYIFSYRFTAKRAGKIRIPPIKVSADNQTAYTKPFDISVKRPSESKDFKLRIDLSGNEIYVGEPMVVTVTWYIGKDVKNFQFSFPLFNDPGFIVARAGKPDGTGGRDLIRFTAEGREIIGKKGRGSYNGTEYTTVSFDIMIIPKKEGVITLPQATVVFNAVVGYRTGRRSPIPFDNFFDDDFFFGNTRREVTKKYVVPSNTPVLKIKALPDAGKPSNFTGLVGQYSISAEASPVDVNVGDPITLTLKVKGPDYLANVDLPPLNKQIPLSSDFKIPSEMAAGTIENGAVTFTQTLRARHEDVKEIPPVSLPYFDTKAGEYRVAYTKPIPINVKATKVVTAEDAEGPMLKQTQQVELKNTKIGIAYNYDDLSVLKNQYEGPEEWLSSPKWIGMIFFPPFIYAVLFTATWIVERQGSDPEKRLSKRALKQFLAEIEQCKNDKKEHIYSDVIDAMRRYLGNKLSIGSGAITYEDVCSPLEARGVDKKTLDLLKMVFDEGDALRFAGGSGKICGSGIFIENAVAAAKGIEKGLTGAHS